MSMGSLDRRQFTAAVALALLGGAAITFGCGGGSSNPNGPTLTPSVTPSPTQSASPGTGGVVGTVTPNHEMPHVAVITAAQLSAGGDLVLDISNGLHSHTVTLTGAQVTLIAGGGRVSVQSSTNTHSDGHNPHHHTVTFN